MEILALIPARGGSKGIPNKNRILLKGLPLICWTINEAKKSKYISRIIVDTEDIMIAEIAKNNNAEVPFFRPKHLAKDDSNLIDTILYSLHRLEKSNYSPDIVIILQPTSPLRTVKDIDSCLKQYILSKRESLISVTELEHSIYWSLRIMNNKVIPFFNKKYLKHRRQQLEIIYRPNGAIFISKPALIKKYRSFYMDDIMPYIMPVEKSIDIDNIRDLQLAKYYLLKGKSYEHNTN